MDIEKLKKNAEGRGFSFRYFDTGAEAADYLTGELAGMTVGFGGSGTLDAIGLYDRLRPYVRTLSGTGARSRTPRGCAP